ncbi:MAG: DUF3089 domain-containing protein [Bacteroidales bacterium]|nr:DUF3089 domain-containing protein [Candidatus Liminaster caballi]
MGVKQYSSVLAAAVCVVLAMLCSCGGNESRLAADVPVWYAGGDAVREDGTIDAKALDQDKIDLIYLVSTEVIAARDEKGDTVYRSTLCDADRKYIDGEMAYAKRYYSKGDFNFLAPYYHQFTFESMLLPAEEYQKVYDDVRQEMTGIITYYLDSINGGRKFALVGFSQGAMLIVDVLKQLPGDRLGNMVGAYVLGFGLDSCDISHENIIPATGETGFGHTVSFNSVMSLDGVWDRVYNNAVTAINPVSWGTGPEPARLVFINDSLTVRLDTATHLLIVDVPDKTPYHEFMNSNPAYRLADVPADCLHRWDLMFYTQKIHDNIIKRAER